MKSLWRYVIYALVAIIAIQQAVIYLGKRAHRAERLRAANLLAASSAQKDWLSGQLRVAARYVYQGQVALDETQRQRDQQAVLATTLQLEARELRGKVTPSPAFTGDTLEIHAGFGSLDTNGVHVDIDAAVTGVVPVPGRPIESLTLFHIQLAPVPLHVGVACEGSNARIYVTGPRYARLGIVDGHMTDEVCNPKPPAWQPLSLRAPSLPWAAGLVGLGWLLRGALR